MEEGKIMSFTNWLKENLSRAEDAVLEGGLNFLLDMCSKFDTSIVPSRLETNGGYQNLGKAQANKDKDKAGYIVNFDTGKTGVPYCSITFRTYQGGGTTEYWSSKDIVWNLFQTDIGTDIQPAKTEDEGLKRIEQENQEQELAKQIQLEQKKATNLAYELEMFRLWPSTPIGTQAKYFKDKQITNFIQGVKYGTDKHGEFAAIELLDARNNQAVGLQKFYDRTVFGKDGTRIGNKKFTWGLSGEQMKHACQIIGKINTYGEVAVCEGYADGVIIHAATGLPVIVALNKNNIEPVTTAIKRNNPLIKFQFWVVPTKPWRCVKIIIFKVLIHRICR